MKTLGIVIVILLFLSSCKTNSTQHTSKNIPAQSRLLPLIDFDALAYVNVYSPFNAFHREKGGESLKNIIFYYLKNRLPEYEIQLSDSIVAYYYAFSCSDNDPICACIFPLKPDSLGFLLIQSSNFSTVLNVNYEFINGYFDNMPTIYTMNFEIGNSGLIHLTQQKKVEGLKNRIGAENFEYIFKRNFKVLTDKVVPEQIYSDLEIHPISKKDLENGKYLIPELEQADYFVIDTRFNSYLRDNCTDSIAQYLKNLIPQYMISLSDNIKAYYYRFNCEGSRTLLCGACFSGSSFDFYLIESPKNVTILNIGFSISRDGIISDLSYNIDDTGTIYLTEWSTEMSEYEEGNEFVESYTYAFKRHVIKVLPDSILYEKYDIYEK